MTAFNTVVTYDLIQSYWLKDRDPAFYLRAGRLVTVAGVLVSIGTAFIAKGYSNIMNYIQTLFSIFNAPLFATFIVAMFWKRATAWGGFWSLVAGTATAYAVNRLAAYHTIFHFGSALSASFWQAIWAFVAGVVVLVADGLSVPSSVGPMAAIVGGELAWALGSVYLQPRLPRAVTLSAGCAAGGSGISSDAAALFAAADTALLAAKQAGRNQTIMR